MTKTVRTISPEDPMTSQTAPVDDQPTAGGTEHDLTTLDGVLAYLAALKPIERAKVARVLAENPVTFARVRRTAIFEATRQASDYDQVAAQLGVTTSAINKAVSAHNREHGTSRRRRLPAAATE